MYANRILERTLDFSRGLCLLIFISLLPAFGELPVLHEGIPETRVGTPLYYKSGTTYFYVSRGYTDPSDENFWDGQDSFLIRIPDSLQKVRGIIIQPDGMGSPQEDDPDYIRYAAALGFATAVSPSNKMDYDLALRVFASDGKHPELPNVPFIVAGNSAGGWGTLRIASWMPDRTIAFFPNVTAPARVLDQVNLDHPIYTLPAIYAVGEFDGLVPYGPPEYDRVISKGRRLGSPWAWFMHQDRGHETALVSFIFFPFMEKMIATRYPETEDPSTGRVSLHPVDLKSGFLVEKREYPDPYTWRQSDLEAEFFPSIKPDQVGTVYEDHYSVRPGPARIWAFVDYTGDPADVHWLPDLDLAYLFRGVAAWNRKLDLTLSDFDFPAHNMSAPIRPPGSSIDFLCKVAEGFEWSRIDLFRGAELIDSVRPEQVVDPKQFTLSHIVEADGIAQGFVLLGYDLKGQLAQVSQPTCLLAIPES